MSEISVDMIFFCKDDTTCKYFEGSKLMNSICTFARAHPVGATCANEKAIREAIFENELLSKVCKWTWDEKYPGYRTDCKNADKGTTQLRRYKYCPYCGRNIQATQQKPKVKRRGKGKIFLRNTKMPKNLSILRKEDMKKHIDKT